MKQITNHTVELTEAEMVVLELFRTLLDVGMSQPRAISEILNNFPADSATVRIVNSRSFIELLLDNDIDITSVDARIVTH